MKNLSENFFSLGEDMMKPLSLESLGQEMKRFESPYFDIDVERTLDSKLNLRVMPKSHFEIEKPDVKVGCRISLETLQSFGSSNLRDYAANLMFELTLAWLEHFLLRDGRLRDENEEKI